MKIQNVIDKSLKNKSSIKNLVHKVNRLFFQHWYMLLFLAAAAIKVLYYGKQISPEYFDYRFLLLPVIASILPIAAVGYLFKDKKRFNYVFILNLILSIILLADTVYYRYFKDIISLGAVRNGLLMKGVMSSVKTLFKPEDLFYLIDIIIIFPFIKIINKGNRKQFSFKFRLLIFLLLFSIGISVDGDYIYKLSKEQPLLITTMSNKLYLTKILGNVNYHILDTYNFISNDIKSMKQISKSREDEINTYFSKKSSATESSTANKGTTSAVNFFNVGKGKNLIMIQVEALQQFVINSKINGQEITPNLNRWIGKSLYFDNYFYQVAAGNTSDAEFMSLNSLYPAASGAAYYEYSGNTLNSLPTLMKEKGYNTSAFHGYVEGFWNRNVMYKKEGFDNFYGETSFNVDEKVGLGLSDKSFLDQSFKKLQAQKQPYFSFLVTLSSHFPFDDVKGYGNFNVSPYDNTLFGNYIKGIHYADQQLGMFLDNLEKSGIADNSIIVLYGDHNAIPKEYIQQLYKFENVSNPTDLQWYQYQKVPMLIHFPKDDNKGVNHTYAGQMDLYPTLANMFDLTNEYMFGKDIFNSTAQNATFRNGSFTDGKIFYVSWTDTFYDIATGKIIPCTEELKTKKEAVLKELSYSDDILNYNLIKKFKN